MRSNLNKVGLALILSLTISLSSNLGAVEIELDKPTKEGYFYIPPKSVKTFDQLSKEEQKKAEELKYDRKKFADWLIENNTTIQPNSGNKNKK